MALDPQRILGARIAPRTVALDARDAILYALAVGLGRNPLDARALRFLDERSLLAVPSMATVIGFDESWIEPAGLDLAKLVHGGQHYRFLAPLPVGGAVRVETRIGAVIDKGPGRGVLVLQETTLAAEEVLAIGTSTLFVRGEGGCGSAGTPPPAPARVPEHSPDRIVTVPTRSDQALLFRLLGDRNRLHLDPAVAAAAGFAAPILHGACTYGTLCAAVLDACCDLDPARLASFEGRFVGPVCPGETLELALWQRPGQVDFRARVAARNAPVMDGGRALLR